MPRRRIDSAGVLDLLRGISLFEKCTDRELREVAKLVTQIHVEAGRVLAQEGEPGREFAVVAEGEATTTVHGVEVSTMGPGSFFGEIALLDPGPRSATVTARTAMELLVMGRPEFESLVNQGIPSISRKMMAVFSERLRHADARMKGPAAEPGAADPSHAANDDPRPSTPHPDQ